MTFEVSAERAVTPQEEQIGDRPTSASSPSLMRVIIPGERVRRRSASNARVTRNAGLSSVIGDFEQDVGVTRLVERAVAREVGAAELLLDVLNRDHQPTA
ncbi:MAG TPA: hypothetical protein VK988_06950, partial [Acidimicrobiales bacterium]|nr:hypothetical protein [Acidimicrobiales bacterium]